MKNKTIFIIIRYSVITSGVKLGLNISKEDYKEKLFSEDRLRNRISLFKKITSKSIVNQKPCDVNLRLVVLTSSELPEANKKDLAAELHSIEERSDFICDLLFVDERESLSYVIKNHITNLLAGSIKHDFATVRLDDDDGLSSSYCQNLSLYLKRGFLGIPISFAYGYEGYFNEKNDEFRNLRHWYYPKIALGLAFTNSYSDIDGYLDKRISVYSLGSHTKIDIDNPILIDSTFPAYFRTVSGHNDSGGYVYHNNLVKVADGDIDHNEFSFMEKIVGLATSSKVVEERVVVSSKYSAAAAKLRHEVSILKKKLSDNCIQ